MIFRDRHRLCHIATSELGHEKYGTLGKHMEWSIVPVRDLYRDTPSCSFPGVPLRPSCRASEV